MTPDLSTSVNQYLNIHLLPQHTEELRSKRREKRKMRYGDQELTPVKTGVIGGPL